MFVLRDHLSHCRECRDEHYSLKTMKYLLSALPDKEPNPEWVAFLAESFSRPAPTFGQRLFLYWERSVNAAISVFVSRSGREGTLVLNRRLASALMLSAVGVFLIATSFDRAPSRVALNPSPASMPTTQTANISPFAAWSGSNRSRANSTALRPGETQFVVIPLPPATFSGAPTIILPQGLPMRPVTSSDRDNYLSSINMHIIPPPGSMSSFGAPLPEPRFVVSSFGH
jgi:hypothetical protein